MDTQMINDVPIAVVKELEFVMSEGKAKFVFDSVEGTELCAWLSKRQMELLKIAFIAWKRNGQVGSLRARYKNDQFCYPKMDYRQIKGRDFQTYSMIENFDTGYWFPQKPRKLELTEKVEIDESLRDED